MTTRKLIAVAACACALATLLATETRSQQRSTSATPSRPNVILIMTDDMGYADLGSYGGRDIKTPIIDRLARDGVRLADAYANGVLCSPTRAALISGRYPQRGAIETALGPEGTRGLAVSGSSLPQLLKNGGYRTGLIGKWHLGGTVTGAARNGGPRAHGFDYFFGLMGSHVDYWHHNRGPGSEDLWEDETKIAMDGQYLTTLITDRSIQFLEQSATAPQPFFLDVAYNAPHWPYNRPDRPSPAPGSGAHVTANAENPPTRADYAAMLEAVDSGVGRILQTVARLGLTENTIVIFTNDNGGEWLSNGGPLFNRKWTVWEGGIRVPAIVKWPGRIRAGSVSDQPAITFDWSASILAAAGVPVPASYEGINILPILEGRATKQERTFFWRSAPNSNRTQQAVRQGDWKLVVDANHLLLYNLREDIGERHDRTAQRPDIVRRLRTLLDEWTRSVDADAKAVGSASAAPSDSPVRGLYNWIHGTGDAERSFSFYRDVFGIELARSPFAGAASASARPEPIRPVSQAGSDPLVWALTNTHGSRFRTVFMRAANTPFGLELSEFFDVPRSERHANPWDPGASKLIFTVRDLNAVVARLVTARAPVVTFGGVPLNTPNGRAILVRDPDGYLVEVRQASPAALSAATTSGDVIETAIWISVAQRDRALAFYETLLGFERRATRPANDAELRVNGVTNGTLTETVMSIPGIQTTVVLAEFARPATANPAPMPFEWRVQDVGSPQFQLEVAGLDALLERTARAGYRFLSVGGKPIDRPFGRFVFAIDPDGVLVEFVEPATRAR